MKILILNSEMKNFNTYTELFKHITSQGLVVEGIENGKLSLLDNEDHIEAQFGEINKENSINPFNEEIVAYRADLRVSLQNLTELGIKIEETETDKLKKTFAFLG